MPQTRRQSLLDEKASLERRLNEINLELTRTAPEPPIKSHYSGKPHHSKPKATVATGHKPDSANRPLREIIIGMLSDVDYMLTNTAIRHLYEAKFQKGLAASRLGTLSHDEFNRKNRDNTTIYGLTHPIQLVEDKIVQVKNVWARSDWPINQRIFLPVTTKLMHLNFLDWYITTSGNARHRYLQSPIITGYIKGIINNLGLESSIQPPYNSTQAKKITIQEIEFAREQEEVKYSALAFKTLSIHKRSKIRLNTGLDDDTNMNL